MKPIKKILVTAFCSLLPALGHSASDCDEGVALFKQSKQTGSPSIRLALLKESVALCPRYANQYNLADAYVAMEHFSQALDAVEGAAEMVNLSNDDRRYSAIEGQKAYIYAKAGSALDNSYCLALEHMNNAKLRLHAESEPWMEEVALLLEAQRSQKTLGANEITCGLEEGQRMVGMRSIMLRGSDADLEGSRAAMVAPRINLNINFATNSSTLDYQGKQQSDELLVALRNFDLSGKRIRIIGHTDSRGSDAHNQSLSQRRADSVKTYLQQAGISASLESRGRGESRLLKTPEQTEQDYALNRRVEIKLLNK